MIETLLTFLATALFAQEMQEGEPIERLRQRVREEWLPEGINRESVAHAAWAAYRDALEWYVEEDDDGIPELEYLDEILSQSWEKFLERNKSYATPVKLVKWDEAMEAGEPPPTYTGLPPGLEWAELRTEDFKWVEGADLDSDLSLNLPIANPDDADWAGTLWIVWLGMYGNGVVVWTQSFEGVETALETAVEWAREGMPGIFVEPEYPEGLEYEDDPEAFQAAEEDLTYTESGWIPSWEWSITEVSDPFAGGVARRDAGLRSGYIEPGEAAIWITYKVRSAYAIID